METRPNPKKAAEKSAQSVAFGRALYALRIKKDFSQEELSFRSEIDRSYLSQIERGVKEPCLGIIFKLSKALDTDPSVVFQTVEEFLNNPQPPPARARNARVR
jgi:transcriptional regulator with XRE-family HTH domain